MYFLSEVESKRLINSVLPHARKVGVSEELRGWSWNDSPMKPYYEEGIPMYAVCSKYCPSGRDVYLNKVEGKKGLVGEKIALGAAIHRTVGTVISSFMEGEKLDFDVWYERALEERGVQRRFEEVREKSRKVWAYTYVNCESRFMNRVSQQPYASRRDSMATALPFLVEHRVTGELLGLSGLLSVDCYDYLHGVVFDLKVSDDEVEWYKIYPTGYAVVLESVYEVPVDVGCTIYVRFQGDRLVVKKDLFFIGDELRSWWLEERDRKLEIVAQRKDPGVPNKCPEDCMYWGECRG